MSANPEVLNRLPDVKAQKGLAANPGKTGEMFDRNHPYFPKDCAHCFLRKGGKIKNMFSNEGKHCLSCQYSTDCTNRAKEIAKWLEKETPTVAEKEAIYAMPIEQQYVSEGKLKKALCIVICLRERKTITLMSLMSHVHSLKNTEIVK